MKIKTITCHDVYNPGASLQAYALAAYLRDCGHEAQIIDYKPDYLSRHYRLDWVANPRFDRPFVRQVYLLAKLPRRLKARKSLRKHRFDAFRKEYLPVTPVRYETAEALRQNCPEAEVYIAGSDQIWNPVFPNGKDPAFFLEFVPEGKKKISYAASFSVESLEAEDKVRMKPWLERLDGISVRESSGAALLAQMGLAGVAVMDPVFLLDTGRWRELAVRTDRTGYILVYDFDSSETVRKIALDLAEKTGKRIVSVFPMEGASEVWADMGPREFLGAIAGADCVLSNSFHATAFSLIFGKEFYVVNRQEKINTRMQDLLTAVGCPERLISALPAELPELDHTEIGRRLTGLTEQSKAFLKQYLV